MWQSCTGALFGSQQQAGAAPHTEGHFLALNKPAPTPTPQADCELLIRTRSPLDRGVPATSQVSHQPAETLASATLAASHGDRDRRDSFWALCHLRPAQRLAQPNLAKSEKDTKHAQENAFRRPWRGKPSGQ
jgi:hypothetical protein